MAGAALAGSFVATSWLAEAHLSPGTPWTQHWLAGAGIAALALAARRAVTGTDAAQPLLWIITGQLAAVAPDALLRAGVAHHRWMDVFILHVTTDAARRTVLPALVLLLLAVAVYAATSRLPSSRTRGSL